MPNTISQIRLKTTVKNRLPLIVKLYHKILHIRRRASYLLPVSIRLRKGMKLSVKDRKKIVQKLYKRKEEQPLFYGKRVLCWEPAPWPIHIALISSFGVALSLRGSKVELVICDGTPVACIGREIEFNEPFSDWRKKCSGCHKACREEANSFGLRTEAIGNLVNSKTLLELRKISQSVDLANIASYHYKSVDAGAHALSSAKRYYKGKVIQFEENILREYLFSALVITEAAIKKIVSFKPDAIYMSHGLYTTWGPVVQLAMQRGVPIIKIGGGYRKQYTAFRKIAGGTTDIFSFGALSNRGWEKRLKKPLSSFEEQKLEKYFRDRYFLNSRNFYDIGNSSSLESKQGIFNKLDIRGKKPVWCIFTHLSWDASLYDSRMAFGDYDEWIVATLKTIIHVPETQWLIKIHPAEKLHDSVEGIQKIIDAKFPKLPNHIKIIHPDTDINTYNLLDAITGGITCKGTVGLELAAMGKPVIVAAEAYYSNKGFTYDGFSSSEYKKLVRKTPVISSVLTPEQKERARKFAYTRFIQRQIPVKMFIVDDNSNRISFDWQKVESLLPRKDPVVDMICERFFEGDDFILSDKIIRKTVHQKRNL